MYKPYLKEIFAFNEYIKEKESLKINDLSIHLKKLEKH